jgi:uncharacterized protein YkwD
MSMYSKHAVVLALPALLISAAFAPSGAIASSPVKRGACDGVRLLADPYLVIGVGPQIIDVRGLADDRVVCQPVGLQRSRHKSACAKAHESGARLRPRVAAESVRCLLNAERRQRGLNALDTQGSLKRAAKAHTRRMISDGCFAHTCPGEADLPDRVTATGYLPCGCSWSVGEDLAWGMRRHSTPAAIVAAWMASDGHREIILTPDMKDVDIGVRRGKPGNAGAAAATYTADFGYRK